MIHSIHLLTLDSRVLTHPSLKTLKLAVLVVVELHQRLGKIVVVGKSV